MSVSTLITRGLKNLPPELQAEALRLDVEIFCIGQVSGPRREIRWRLKRLREIFIAVNSQSHVPYRNTDKYQLEVFDWESPAFRTDEEVSK